MAELERAVIAVATEYAAANGYDREDRTAIGLVLAGMAIMASCSQPVQDAMRGAYLVQQPEQARERITGWAVWLNGIEAVPHG